jgi:alpha-methylacyl-CoA racemase
VGTLDGIRIIEMAGIGPCPFAAMMLADMGADVIRIDRAQMVSSGDKSAPSPDVMNRGRRSVGVDLKHPQGVETVLKLVEHADVLIEGFRPGVMERLHLGPENCLQRNERLVYGRMTGWGQTGPMAKAAGHDINYIALAGVLESIGRKDEVPVPPLNLVGDFGGGGMLLAVGVLAALVERITSGKGQVVDAAMVDGAALLGIMVVGMRNIGMWNDVRGTNMLDTGAAFYEVYKTKDNKFVALGAIEPQFYHEFIQKAGLADRNLPMQLDHTRWPELKAIFTEVFLTKTRDEWCSLLEGTDACFAPVLAQKEAHLHPHNQARSTFVDVAGVVQPGPAPRFERTPSQVQRPPPMPGAHSDDILQSWGFSAQDVEQLRQSKAIA